MIKLSDYVAQFFVGRGVHGAPAARYVPDTQRAEETLGLRPMAPLETGIQRTYDWWAGVREEAGVPA